MIFCHTFSLCLCVGKLLNLHIFKRAEPIGGEQKCHKVRYRGHCARVEIGEGGVVAKENGEASANTNGWIGKSEIFSVTFIGKDKVVFKGRFGKYLVAELNGRVNANRGVPGPWETWTVEKKGKWKFAFKSFHGKYLVAESNGEINANRDVALDLETFRVVTCPAWVLGPEICK